MTYAATVRREHLQKLAPLCKGLVAALEKTGLGPAESQAVLRTSVSADCVICQIRVSGEELFNLSHAESLEESSHAKLERMRQGYCARQGCDSYYYQLNFQPHPPLDWAQLIEQAEGDSTEAAGASEPSPTKSRFSFHIPRQLWVGLAVLVLLLVLRQLYYGGRIPLIREPEQFRVDPAPQEQPGN